MITLTIPEKLTKKGDLVLIPKSEYEEFVRFQRIISIVQPTSRERKAIAHGKAEVKRGNFTPWSKIKHGLARRSR